MHAYDPYINIQRGQLNLVHIANPEADVVLDTSLLQLMVLEKFMHGFGYRLNEKGQFEDVNPKSPAKVITFSSAVKTYNRFTANTPPQLLQEYSRGLMLKKIYLVGKSLRTAKAVKHKVKFV